MNAEPRNTVADGFVESPEIESDVLSLARIMSHPSAMRRQGAAGVVETRFGKWFLGTNVWRRYVLLEALVELERLLGRPGERFTCVADVGCGRGLALPFLADRFRPHLLIGIDVDPEMIAGARGNAAGHSSRTDLRIGDARQLELADGSVDLLLCHQLLHHVREQRRVLAEFHRVLCPGGALLLAESCESFVSLPWVRLLFRHPMDAQRTADQYLALVRDAGFELSAVSTPDPWWSRRDLGLVAGRSESGARPLVYVAATRSSGMRS